MSNYIVKSGESINDVCLNISGTLGNTNLDKILEENNFSEWNPTLISGQILSIPDTLQNQSNVTTILNTYPVCNRIDTDVESQITALISKFANNVLFDDTTEIEALFDTSSENALYN